MSYVVYLREGSWPWQRVAPLITASNVDCPRGLMQGYRGGFSLARNDPAVAEMLSGRMVEIISTDGLEPWVGWLAEPGYSSADGTVAFKCDDVVTKLGERNTTIEGTRSGSAGIIARDLLFSVNIRNAFGVVWDTSSETGAPVSEADVGGTSLLNALDKLVSLTDEEWWIRAEVAADSLELKLHWGKRRGVDLSQSVYLREGLNCNVSILRTGPATTGSVMVVGGSGSLVDRQIVVRDGVSPERMADPNVIVQSASESFRRAAPLSSALAAEQLVSLPRDTDIADLAGSAKSRLEGEIDTSEEITITVGTDVDWSLLEVGNTVTVIFEDPILGTLQRTPRIKEITPGDGILEVKCFKPSWGLIDQLRRQGAAIEELELT